MSQLIQKLGRLYLMVGCLFVFLAVGALGVSAAEDTAALKKRAEAGDAVAQYNLGVCYAKGEGVAKDEVEAVKWCRKAAEQGHAHAQYSLGVCYAIGEGVPKNEVEAAKWYRKAAEQGHVSSQVNLGVCYHKGEGVPKDEAEAVKWFRKAAEQGDAKAQYNLGLQYDNGEGVPKDKVEAVKWYRKAAEQGVVNAQYNLGLCSANGEGVPKDDVEALAWFNLAASSGDENAKTNRDIMERRLGREATLLAQQRSKEFLREIEVRKNRIATSSGVTGPAEAAGDEPKATGSGVFVTADGMILSAAHLVRGTQKVRVVTSQGIKTAKVFQMDEANDVAILKCEGTFVPSPIVASGGVRLGQMVFTLGFPNIGLQGFEPKLTKGEISSMGGIQDDPRQWQISAPVQPGNSGGPLFEENGNVVGVVVARLSDRAAIKSSGAIPQNINYAVKSAYVMPLLEPFNSRLFPPRKPTSSVKFEDVVAKARESVVLVVAY